MLPLAELGPESLSLAGGKATALGALLRAGLPVPPGYVVTTEAFRRRDQDAQVSEAIRAAYRRLEVGPVAVRSSSTTEDQPGAAFAGQHDTFLNVVGEDAVLTAVHRCWASLWTERAVDYRSELGLDDAASSMAVVVQAMVDSEVAGVIFTADPVSGARELAAVDASPGLGEAVAAGLVTPDHYLVHKRTGRARTITLGRAEVAIRSVRGGGVTQTTGAVGTTPVLTRSQLRELTRLATRIERLFGQPQDIEWALADGRFHILQARAMTALPTPVDVSRAQRAMATMLAELLPIRPTPMDVTSWTAAGYAGVELFVGSMGVRPRSFEDLLVEQDGVLVELVPVAPRVGPSTPVRMLRSAVHGDRYSREVLMDDPRMRRFLAGVSDGLGRDLTLLPYADLEPTMTGALELFVSALELRSRFLARAVLALGRFQITLRLLNRGRLIGTLMAGVETRTAETNRWLEELADRIRADAELARTFVEQPADRIRATLAASPSGVGFLADFDAFLRVHGHRESLLLYVSQPCWRDAPETVLALLKASAGQPAAATANGTARAERELFAHPLTRLPPIRRRVEVQLERARGFTQFREDTHYYATMAQPVVRRILLEYGRRLTDVGALAAPEEVFWLRRDELALTWPPGPEDRDRLRALVEHRRRVSATLGRRPVVDRRYLSVPPKDGSTLARGTAGAAGVATGPVRIIRSAAEFDRLQPGEVLVAPYTNPSWTPLFRRAAAVVVDTGGPGSHAAIVAREYGIPAVLGTLDAVDTLAEGSLVTVDGNRGVVLPG
ncbi:hypothetical protein GCM10009841_15690 [Microlunatus panaciterrae]